MFKAITQTPSRLVASMISIPARGKKIKIRRKNYPPKVLKEPNHPVIPYQRFDKTLPEVTADIEIPEPLSMKSYYEALHQKRADRKANRQMYNILDLMRDRNETPVFIDRVSLLKKCLEKNLPIPTMTYLKHELSVLMGMDFVKRVMLPTVKGRSGFYFANTRRIDRGLKNKEKRANEKADAESAGAIETTETAASA